MVRFPNPLKKGDLIRLISPAGPNDAEKISAGKATLRSWGYRVDLGSNALKKNNYTAGSDEERLSDLVDALSNPEVKGILCTRGGYGSARLLNIFPWSIFEDTVPKTFIGFSDISALMLSFWSRYQWVSYFGPQVANGLNGNFSDRSLAHFHQIIKGESMKISWVDGGELILTTVVKGSGSGHLVPCCLSILVSLIGTPFFPDLTNSVLCIEDLNEPLYKYDRMLTQLSMSGVVNNITGLILGRFIYKDEDISSKVALAAADVFSKYDIPIWTNMPFGHVDERLTLPIGIRVQVSTSGELTTLE